MNFQRPPIESPLELTSDGRISSPVWMLWLLSLACVDQVVETATSVLPSGSAQSTVGTGSETLETQLNTLSNPDSSTYDRNNDILAQILMSGRSDQSTIDEDISTLYWMGD